VRPPLVKGRHGCPPRARCRFPGPRDNPLGDFAVCRAGHLFGAAIPCNLEVRKPGVLLAICRMSGECFVCESGVRWVGAGGGGLCGDSVGIVCRGLAWGDRGRGSTGGGASCGGNRTGGACRSRPCVGDQCELPARCGREPDGWCAPARGGIGRDGCPVAPVSGR
jgi:hypothetical protein